MQLAAFRRIAKLAAAKGRLGSLMAHPIAGTVNDCTRRPWEQPLAAITAIATAAPRAAAEEPEQWGSQAGWRTVHLCPFALRLRSPAVGTPLGGAALLRHQWVSPMTFARACGT